MKQIFYTCNNILKEDAQYNIIYGERSNGKSYSVKLHCLQQAYKKGIMLGYIRRFDTDIKPVAVESYFADTPIRSITNGDYETITVYRGEIFLANYDDNFKIKRGMKVGHVFALNLQESYKSRAFTNVGNLIFEEFITNKRYLVNEPSELFKLVSTIARRNKIKVWLIGNTVSRVCPYINDWSLLNIMNQKQGTIDTYNFKTDQKDESGDKVVVKIAVEYCGNNSNNSKMFFGKKAKSITGGSWEVEDRPTIDKISTPYEKSYEILLKAYNFSFVMQLCVMDTGVPFLYVYPYTSHRKIERVITEDFSENPLHTSKLFETENIVKELIKNKQVVFSDNLTGEDFNNILKNISI